MRTIDMLILIACISAQACVLHCHIASAENKIDALTSGRMELREVEKGKWTQCRVMADSLGGAK